MKTKLIVLTSAFSALIFIFTAYILHIPIGVNGGYIHLGDSIIYICAALLPFPYALLASAIGAGLADIASGAIVWLPATIVIKPLMALFFSSKSELKSKRNIAAPIFAGILGVLLYYVYECFLFESYIVALNALPLGVMQAVGNAFVYYVFAQANLKAIKINV